MSAQILIVHDEQDVRSALRIVLELEGYSVLEASHDGIAIKLLREPPIDVAILELFMADQGGLETILQMRLLAPKVKIIAIAAGSSYGLTDMLQVARAFGADLVLPTPFNPQVLLTAVRELLTGTEL